jgi:hypothetical protein
LRGLVRRRAAEAELFRNGNHEAVHAAFHQSRAADDPDEQMPQGVDIPPGTPKPMRESKIGNAQIAIGAAGAAEVASKVKDGLDQANAIKQGAHDLGMLDAVSHVASMPTFWLAVAGFAWYWRREHAQNGV